MMNSNENGNNFLHKTGNILKNKKVFVPAIILLVLLIATATFYLFRPQDRSEPALTSGNTETTKTTKETSEATIGFELEKPFELIPIDTDKNGTGVGSAFQIILSKNDYTVEQLMGSISIIPETEFTIEKKAKDYLLKPATQLKPNQVYSVAFADEAKGVSYTWAFQTRKALFITGTLPRHQATYVPVNTGIEVTFSQREVGDISNYFEITPKVNGRFENHKNTVVFVPHQELSYDTVYTVTVKRGFGDDAGGQSLREDTVFSFQTVPVPEPKEYGYSCDTFDFVRNNYNLYPYEAPILSVRTNLEAGTEVEFRVYQYDTGEDFKKDISVQDRRPFWCMHYNRPKSIEGKRLVLSMNTVLQSDNEDTPNWYYSTQYLIMPEPLPEGYYIVSLKLGEMERRAFLQVNGMAAYVGAADNKTIAMVYDSHEANPVKGAVIKFEDFSLTTGLDGLAVCDEAVFNKDSSYTKNYEIHREGHPVYYAAIGGSYYSYYNWVYGYYVYSYHDFSSGDIQDEYWGYLFTDRNMYMPSDTISVWGMLTGKDGHTAPKKATVTLSSQSHNYPGSPIYNIIDEKEVSVTGPNTFQTELSYENLSDGYYQIKVASGERTLLSKSIRIMKYTKPIYTLKTGVDKQNVVYGEELAFNLEAKFFEGTPVNGMKLNYNIHNLSENNTGQLTTDINGRAELSIHAIVETTSWHPIYASVNISNADPEETEVYAYKGFTIFPRDTMVHVESKTDVTDNQCTVNIETHKINVDEIRYKDWYQESDYKGEKASVDMEVILYEAYYTQTQMGTYYNFITKTTYPRYHYERHEREIKRFKVQTANGTGAIQFTKETDKGYYIQISCKDGAGRPIIQTHWLYDARYYDVYDGRFYSLETYYLESDKGYDASYDADATVRVSLKTRGKTCEVEENKKVLYMQYRKGMLEYHLTHDTTYSFPFKKEYIPNMGVMAVYFDGKSMKQASMYGIYYNAENNRLHIEVTPSSDEYRPGDTAHFDITVTDASGKGRIAEVLLSVVDEAFFAISPQSVNLLESIYRQNVSLGYRGGSIPYSNVLEDYHNFWGAEGGEGGDEYSSDVRADFKDTALFESIITDQNGHGTIQVKLPDNLTQWRVTYQGVTEDLYAGNGQININTRLPFFVNSVFHNVFITGDKPVIQLRSFGTALKEGMVEYRISVNKNGELWKEYVASAAAGQRSTVQLEALEEGSYTYTVSGIYGEYHDAVLLPFEVLPGFIEQSRTEYTKLTGNIQFPAVKWPATVYFFNENVQSFWKDLIDLSYSWHDRIDSIIVRKQARKLRAEFFGETWWDSTTEYNTANFQLSNGGIALLPYDSANPVLTAKICSLQDPDFDYEKMKGYFYRTIASENATSTDVTASYWGLACLREPVLLDLEELLKSEGLLLVDKLYIGLAYAYIGDINQASGIFKEISNGYLKEDDYRAYIQNTNENYDSDDIQEATSLCALLAYQVNAPQKSKLFEYARSMRSRDILTGAIRLQTIKSNIKTLNMLSSFTYELDGKTETVTVQGRGTYSMVLTADKLSRIRFSNIKGSIIAATVFTAPIRELSATDPRISVSRAYTGQNGLKKTTFDTSEYIKVDLYVQFEPTAPTGYYMVEDYLPSCFRFVSGYTHPGLFRDTREWYPLERTGQKVSFYVYHNNLGRRDRTITYFVRAVNTGEYTADHAAAFNLESNMIGYAPRDRMTVQ